MRSGRYSLKSRRGRVVTNLKFLQLVGPTLLWAALRHVKGGPGWIACAVGRIILPRRLAIYCIYNNCKCIYDAAQVRAAAPRAKGHSKPKGGVLWNSATSP